MMKMKSKLSIFLRVFNNIVEKNLAFLFFTRGIEFQKQAIVEFESLLKKTSKLKRKMIEDGNEEASNILLSLENLVRTYINELKMYVFLKEGDMSNAWVSLVEAQHSLTTAFQANDIVLKYDGEKYLERLELLEKAFFPPQTFNSIEATVQSSKCSICGQEYGDCTHVIGRPYMGQICYRIFAKVQYEGLSILVENPADKRCRITEFSDDNGYMRDALTLRIANQTKK
jgi:hypothetical protein